MTSTRQIDKIHQFFNSDFGIKEYIKKNFQDTGKLINISSTISQDCTREIKTLLFNSREDYNDFANNEILQYQNIIRDRYNTYHNIAFNQIETEI